MAKRAEKEEVMENPTGMRDQEGNRTEGEQQGVHVRENK